VRFDSTSGAGRVLIKLVYRCILAPVALDKGLHLGILSNERDYLLGFE
jgi:hypothetical protein